MREKGKNKSRNRWLYVIMGMIALLVSGQIYAWPVMSQPISAAHPDWTAAQLSLTFTLTMIFLCGGNLISGIVSKRMRPGRVLLLAGVLFLTGFFVVSFTRNSLWTLYLGFGILAGLGTGFVYNTVISTVSAWFPDKQGLASGIMLMGFGLSSFLFGNLFTAVTPADGSGTWCVTFRVFGVVIFAVLLVASIFIVRPDADWEAPVAKEQKSASETAVDLAPGGMFRTRTFWLFYFWLVVNGGAGMALVSQASGVALEAGPTISATAVAMAVGMISILNGIGRVVYGALYDRIRYRFTMMIDIFSFVAMELLLILALWKGSFFLSVCGFMLGGFAYGALSPITSAVAGDFFGRSHYALNFSIIMTNGMLASVASTVAGRLYDISLSYRSTLFMMLGMSLVGFVLFLGVRRPEAMRKKNGSEERA